jgi:hypothetical protein
MLMEREAALDKYLDTIKVEIVQAKEEGRNRIKDNLSLFKIYIIIVRDLKQNIYTPLH